MKIYRIIFTLLLALSCASVFAQSNSRSEKKSVFTDHYGIVNAIYSDESRIVISDVSLLYKHSSAFYNAQGRRVSSIKNILKPGTAVIYHYYQKSPNLILKDVKVISMREHNKAKETEGELY
jgi:hypothetical protein